MCLVTTQNIPLVAKEDIVVYKLLRRIGDNEWVTPFQIYPIQFNKVLNPKSPSYFDNRKYHHIGDGYVHAFLYLVETHPCEQCFKAIIKKGTKFFIDNNLYSICAESLYITDIAEKPVEDSASNSAIYDKIKEICSKSNMSDLFVEQEINGNKVAIGYLCTPDKSFINPFKYNGEEIIGIVGDIKDNNVTIIALKYERLPWSLLSEKTYCVYKSSGKVNTKSILTKGPTGCYPAFKYALEYSTEGTKQGDWYLGAIDELQEVFNNYLILNIAKLLSSFKIFNTWIWSSTEYSLGSAWVLYGGSPVDYLKAGNGFSVYPLLQIKL